MLSRFKSRELDDQELRVLSHIEQHGWNVTNIREQDGNPGWAFTIGLFESYGHAEVNVPDSSCQTEYCLEAHSFNRQIKCWAVRSGLLLSI